MILLDFDEFTSLYETCERLDAREVISRTWQQMAAAQGTAKGVKEFLKPWTDVMKKSTQGRNDLAAFLQAFRNGI